VALAKQNPTAILEQFVLEVVTVTKYVRVQLLPLLLQVA